MIAASRPARIVHALLDHRPAAVIGDDEAVQIEVKPILDGGAVNLRHQPAETGERQSIESHPPTDRNQFVGRLARMLAAAAADMNAEFVRPRLEAALQRADDARRDPGRVPVHAHDRAERLKPKRMSKATKELVATIVMDDRLGDDRAEPGHAIRQPQRHPPAMERQIGASCSMGHAPFYVALTIAATREPMDGANRDAGRPAQVRPRRLQLLPKLSSKA